MGESGTKTDPSLEIEDLKARLAAAEGALAQRGAELVKAHTAAEAALRDVTERRRAAEEMKDTARAVRKFFDAAPDAVRKILKATGKTVVTGFTG